MALGPGARLGGYEIVAPLGAGGMGEVWRALDTRLDRAVALKVLPEAFTRDPDRLARFEREAKALAALSHPGIAALYGLEVHEGRHVLVMELVSGEDLATLLGRGPLAVPEALRVAGQIAEALSEAHGKGIVHRDLKPGNVRVSRDGRVKLIDFGLARTLPGAMTSPDGFSQLPTLGSPTREGAIVGTVAYMSPEQARGLPVDGQTDIWAFGVVLFEMLAGRRPFTGTTLSDTLAAVLKEDPDWSALPKQTPAAVGRLLRRCLERDPRRRLHAIADAQVELQEAATPERRHGLAAGGRGRAVRLFAAVAALALVALASVWVMHARRGDDALRPGRLTRVTTASGLELDPVLSPDGRTLAYAAGSPGAMRLYVQQVAGGRVLPVAEALLSDQRWPQWSPDGSRILFHAGVREDAASQQADSGALYVVPALGGMPRRLLGGGGGAESADPPFCASWSPDGARIAFTRGNGMSGRAIHVADVAPGGTERRLVDAVDAHSLRWSPDGTQIAYVSGNPRFTFGGAHFGNDARSSIVLVAVATGGAQRISSGEWLDLSPVWTPDGRALLFVSNREGARDVYRVGLRSGEPEGAPERITSGLNAHGIDLSADGRTLAYSVYTPRAHIWSLPLPETDSASLSQATALSSGSERVEGLALSADGRFVAYDTDRSGNGDIWKLPVGGGAAEQLTTHASGDYVGDWSPDGEEIAFHSFRAGRRQVYVMAVDGSAVQQVAESPNHQANPDWSPDGNSLAFDSWLADGRTAVHVVARRQRGAAWQTPRLLTPSGGSDPSWSPDGRLIAYVANRALRVVSPSGEDDRVVVDGSRPAQHPEPRFGYWSADARTLYYKAYDDQERSSIWSVPVAGGTPRLLIRFDDPMRPSSRREFATDGRRLYFTIAEHESDIWVMELLPR